jgi:hypothetical protein
MSHGGTWREPCLSFGHAFVEANSTARDKSRRGSGALLASFGITTLGYEKKTQERYQQLQEFDGPDRGIA